MHIPDPIERIQESINRRVEEIGPDGKCIGCNTVVGFDNLHPINANPDSPVACWGCCVEHWGGDPTVKENID